MRDMPYVPGRTECSVEGANFPPLPIGAPSGGSSRRRRPRAPVGCGGRNDGSHVARARRANRARPAAARPPVREDRRRPVRERTAAACRRQSPVGRDDGRRGRRSGRLRHPDPVPPLDHRSWRGPRSCPPHPRSRRRTLRPSLWPAHRARGGATAISRVDSRSVGRRADAWLARCRDRHARARSGWWSADRAVRPPIRRPVGARRGTRRGDLRAPGGVHARRAARTLVPGQQRRPARRARRRPLTSHRRWGSWSGFRASPCSPRTAAATCPP